MRHTGGFAFGATRTKSRFNLAAISSASCRDLIPNCSPFGSIKRTSRARIFSLIIKSLLITSHLQGFFRITCLSHRTPNLSGSGKTADHQPFPANKKVWMHTTPTLLTFENNIAKRNDLSTAMPASTRWEAGCFCFSHKQVFYSLYTIYHLGSGMSRRFSWLTNNVFHYSESLAVWQVKMRKPWRKNFTVFVLPSFDALPLSERQ